MPQSLTAVSIFLASPSDVGIERNIVTTTIDAWNVRHSRTSGVVFQLLKWETSVSAGFGEDGQQVINTQIDDRYDVLIALFWTRLGSPTPRAPSGTVEEYEGAWLRFRNGENVDIAFFFKNSPIDPKTTDLTQVLAVNNFEIEVQKAGALTKNFTDSVGLENEIIMLLDRLSRTYAMGAPEPIRPSSGGGPRNDGGDNTAQNNDDEVGLFDVIESLSSHASKGGAFLDSLMSNLMTMTDVTAEVTSEFEQIKAVRSLDADEMKPRINRVADGMDRFSTFSENESADYQENLTALINDVRSMISLSYDWIESDNDMLASLVQFRQMILEMGVAISGSVNGLVGMAATISGLPRTTTRFNKSKNRLLRNVDVLVSVNRRGSVLVEQALSELNSLIVTYETKSAMG